MGIYTTRNYQMAFSFYLKLKKYFVPQWMHFSWLLLSEKPHFNPDGYFKAFLQKDDNKPLVLVVFLKRCLHFERNTKRCCVLTRLRKKDHNFQFGVVNTKLKKATSTNKVLSYFWLEKTKVVHFAQSCSLRFLNWHQNLFIDQFIDAC